MARWASSVAHPAAPAHGAKNAFGSSLPEVGPGGGEGGDGVAVPRIAGPPHAQVVASEGWDGAWKAGVTPWDAGKPGERHVCAARLVAAL
jgi:hypothetical protein